MLVIVLFLAACVLSASGAMCPHPEFVYPCTCRPWETGIFVVCHQVNDTNRLRSVFQLLRDYEITRLLLKDVTILETSGPSIFSGMHIKLLRLIDSRLTRTDSSRKRPGAISVLYSHLERLDLTHCEGQFNVGQISFGTMNVLKDLNVVRDSLSILKRNRFPNPSNITNLRLEQCSITEVQSGALLFLTSLKSLTFSKNELSSFKRDVLPPICPQLLSVDLSENRIQSLERNFFQGMPNLHTLNLYGNRLQTLDQATWTLIWSQLDKLWINQNNITCDGALEWICEQDRQPPLLFGECSEPKLLSGTSLTNLRPDDLQDRD